MQKRHTIKQEDLANWVGPRKCSSYTHLPSQFMPTLATVPCVSQGKENNILLRNLLQHCLPKDRDRNARQEYNSGGHFNDFCSMFNSIGSFCLSIFFLLLIHRNTKHVYQHRRTPKFIETP